MELLSIPLTLLAVFGPFVVVALLLVLGVSFFDKFTIWLPMLTRRAQLAQKTNHPGVVNDLAALPDPFALWLRAFESDAVSEAMLQRIGELTRKIVGRIPSVSDYFSVSFFDSALPGVCFGRIRGLWRVVLDARASPQWELAVESMMLGARLIFMDLSRAPRLRSHRRARGPSSNAADPEIVSTVWCDPLGELTAGVEFELRKIDEHGLYAKTVFVYFSKPGSIAPPPQRLARLGINARQLMHAFSVAAPGLMPGLRSQQPLPGPCVLLFQRGVTGGLRWLLALRTEQRGTLAADARQSFDALRLCVYDAANHARAHRVSDFVTERNLTVCAHSLGLLVDAMNSGAAPAECRGRGLKRPRAAPVA